MRRLASHLHVSPGCIPASIFLLLNLFPPCCTAVELKSKTVEAFERYIRIADARMDGELRRGGPFLWVDSLPQPQRQGMYDLLQRGQLEIRQEKIEEEGAPIEVPDGLIHHWTGIMFVPGVSLAPVMSLLQDYGNHWRTSKPEIRRSKLQEHTDNVFRISLQFYRDSPRRVSFNAEFEVHYTRIDATHVISRAVSTRIAELQQPERPDSAEFPVGQGHGYLWRLNNYWRLEEKGWRSLHAGGIHCAQPRGACDLRLVGQPSYPARFAKVACEPSLCNAAGFAGTRNDTRQTRWPDTEPAISRRRDGTVAMNKPGDAGRTRTSA